MKILVDTNILISAVLFPRSKPAKALVYTTENHEIIPAAPHAQKLIRDAKDQPILNAAMLYDVDIILTGDKDFLSLEMDRPKCVTVTQFLHDEGVEL